MKAPSKEAPSPPSGPSSRPIWFLQVVLEWEGAGLRNFKPPEGPEQKRGGGGGSESEGNESPCEEAQTGKEISR